MANRSPQPAPRQQYPPKAQPQQPAAHPPHRAPQQAQPARPQAAPRPAKRPAQALPLPKLSKRTWLLLGGGTLLMIVTFCAASTLGVGLIYAGGGILPGVQVAGVDVGGQSVEEATITMDNHWQQNGILLADNERTWTVLPSDLGIYIDTTATAQAAHDYGRSTGGSIFGGIKSTLFGADVAPVVSLDINQARAKLTELAPQLEQPAVNAGVQLVGGQVQPTAAVEGRSLDIEATLTQLQTNPGKLIADGRLELVMYSTAPAVTDSSSMVALASLLLANPLQIQAYNPVTDETQNWSVDPTQWSQWLTATSDTTQVTGLALTLNPAPLRDYLTQQNNALGSDSYINVEESVTSIQQAVMAQNTSPFIRVYNNPKQHTVLPGETISSIAYDYGIPYMWVVEENPGVDALSVGQNITIPSADEMLPLPIVYNKRIVVSISQQEMWAYENGQVKWDWVVSTGISSSPTWPGVFQIQSHEGTAYAGNWNLWMPSFMGVYRPVPSSEFMNGFHGFPSRNGSQILWTSNLGSPITYGCILLSSENAEALYDWAEEGVVVEIQR
jgi:lipoprotein-anchoring transpeptidase ErfK/SrfK